MAIRNLRYEGEEILKKKSREVEVIDDTYVKCTWDVESYDEVYGYLFDGKSSGLA